MKKIIWLLILVLIPLVSAEIEVEPSDSIYGLGDFVDLRATFTNNFDTAKTFIIEEVLLHDKMVPFPSQTIENLGPGAWTVLGNIGFTVTNITYPGEYIYQVNVYDENGLIETDGAAFEIEGTLNLFDDFTIEICADSDCNESKDVFVVYQGAYVKAFGYEDADLEGWVGSKRLSFENGSALLDASRAGEFEVRVKASKGGYLDEELTAAYAVLEEWPSMERVPRAEGIEISSWLYWVIGGVVLVGAVVLIVLLTRKKKPKALPYQYQRFQYQQQYKR